MGHYNLFLREDPRQNLNAFSGIASRGDPPDLVQISLKLYKNDGDSINMVKGLDRNMKSGEIPLGEDPHLPEHSMPQQ